MERKWTKKTKIGQIGQQKPNYGFQCDLCMFGFALLFDRKKTSVEAIAFGLRLSIETKKRKRAITPL